MYRHQDESTLPVRAEDIYTKYFGDNPESPLNVDDPTIEDVRVTGSQFAFAVGLEALAEQTQALCCANRPLLLSLPRPRFRSRNSLFLSLDINFST